MVVDLLPTYADRDGDPLRLTLGIDGRKQAVEAVRETGNRDWAMAVLDNRLSLTLPGELAGGPHGLSIEARDGGVSIEAVRFIAVKADHTLH
jgi:hypothetical protein